MRRPCARPRPIQLQRSGLSPPSEHCMPVASRGRPAPRPPGRSSGAWLALSARCYKQAAPLELGSRCLHGAINRSLLRSWRAFWSSLRPGPSPSGATCLSCARPRPIQLQRSGPDPAAGGTFTYSSAGLFLAPATVYFIMATSQTPVADGAYPWSYTSSFRTDTSSDWILTDFAFSSPDGVELTRMSTKYVQFGVTATEVPEPSSWLLVALGLAGWRCWRKPVRR